MCFPVGGTDITSDKRSPGIKITITKPVLHLFLDLGKENVFYHILERKNNFLGCKNKKFTKSKNWHFFNGATPWFWSKMAIFPSYFF